MRLRDSTAFSPLNKFRPSNRCASTTPTEKSRNACRDLKIRLFGTHVIGLAGDDFALLIGQKAARLGDAEIGQLHVAFKGDHDVFETHVAVNDASGLPSLSVFACA